MTVADFLNAGGEDNPCPISMMDEFWFAQLNALVSAANLYASENEELRESNNNLRAAIRELEAKPKKKAAKKRAAKKKAA